MRLRRDWLFRLGAAIKGDRPSKRSKEDRNIIATELRRLTDDVGPWVYLDPSQDVQCVLVMVIYIQAAEFLDGRACVWSHGDGWLDCPHLSLHTHAGRG